MVMIRKYNNHGGQFNNRLAIQVFMKSRARRYINSYDVFKPIVTVRWHRYIEYKYRGNL